MQREFPSLPNTAQTRAEVDDDDLFDDDDEAVDLNLPEALKPATAAFNDDLLWEYKQILPPVAEADAPSECSWSLRQWRRNPKSHDKFVALIMKTCPEKSSNYRRRDHREMSEKSPRLENNREVPRIGRVAGTLIVPVTGLSCMMAI